MVAAIFVGVVFAADLSGFPGNLATVSDNLSTLDTYVVVGATAATDDVVGAVDLAFALATQSYQVKSATGVVSGVSGTEKKIAIPTTDGGDAITGGVDPYDFPSTLRTFHFDGLKQGEIDPGIGEKISYYEKVDLGATYPSLTHKLLDPVNGTLKMKIGSGSNQIVYSFVWDENISASKWNTTSAPNYDTPLVVNIAGTQFQIVRTFSTYFDALTGSVGWVQQGATTGVILGDLDALVDQVYSGTKASIRIVDKNNNLVKDVGVVGTTAISFTYGGDTYNVKVLTTATSGKESVADSAKILIAKGDAEKSYKGDSNSLFPGEIYWKVGGTFAVAGQITKGDTITVTYDPTLSPAIEEKSQYYVAGSVFKGPNDYFEISYAGLSTNKFDTVTIDETSGVTVYDSTATSAPTVETGLRGIRIASGLTGTIGYGGNNYKTVAVLFNESGFTGNFTGTYAHLAYYDDTSKNWVKLAAPAVITDGGSAAFSLNYGGAGEVSYTLRVWYSSSTLISNVTVNATNPEVVMYFQNYTAAKTNDAQQLKLGATIAKAEDADVKIRVEGTARDSGIQIGDVLSDGGTITYGVSGNAAGDKVVIGIPAETPRALVQFGKIGASATGGNTYNAVVGVTSAVAKLDTEMTSAMKTEKNLVLVGGPCVNTLAQALVDAAKAPLDANYTCTGGLGTAWEANTGYLMLISDAFTTGKFAILAAGTNAAQTRMATSILQDYPAYATQLTGTLVKFTGTSISTVAFG